MREMGNAVVETAQPKYYFSAYNVVLSVEVSTRRFESAMEETSQ